MKLLGAGLLLAALAHAQTYEIRGSITEPGVGGITGIEVTIQFAGNPTPARVTTDSRGVFRLSVDRPGRYLIVPLLPEREYAPESIAPAPSDLFPVVNVRPGSPTEEIHFTYVRFGQITGLVLDEESREPVTDHVIYLLSLTPRPSPVPAETERPVKTDRNGRFAAPRLVPGAYVIATRPALQDRTVGYDYARTYWPGGRESAADALAVKMGSGGIVDIGTILLRKVSLHQVRVSIPQGECPEDESVRLLVLQPGVPAPTKPTGMYRCGSEALLRGLDPGSYTIYAVSDWQGERDAIENAVWGTAELTVTDRDEDVVLPLRRGVTLEGRIIAAEGASLPEAHPTIATRSASTASVKPPFAEFIQWTGPTTFRISTIPGPLELYQDPGKTYVKELRYNGLPVSDGIIPASGSGRLDLVLDDRFSTVEGTILDNTTAATVVLVKQPGRSPLAHPVNGRVSIPRVVPGDYKILAIRPQQLAWIDEPAVLERALAGAEKITLAPGATLSVTLRLTELGR